MDNLFLLKVLPINFIIRQWIVPAVITTAVSKENCLLCSERIFLKKQTTHIIILVQDESNYTHRDGLGVNEVYL